jgi:hypothetical protein
MRRRRRREARQVDISTIVIDWEGGLQPQRAQRRLTAPQRGMQRREPFSGLILLTFSLFTE